MIDPCTSHCHRKREERSRYVTKIIAVHPSLNLKLKIAVLLVFEPMPEPWLL